jgi:hypothetical protein
LFPWKTVNRGLLLSPLPVWGALSVLGFFSDLSVPGWSWREAIGHEAFVFPYYVLGSYVIAFTVALPLYALGWKYFRVSFFSCLFWGAMIGGVPAWTFFALQVYGLWPKWQDESLGGVPLIVAGKFTHAGLVHYFMSGVSAAVLSMAIAFVFWWIAIRKNPASQSRRFAIAEGGVIHARQ